MHATCDAACQPQPITPRLAAPSFARWRAATPDAAPVRSCPSLSASITASSRAFASEKSRTTNGVPADVHAYDFTPGVAELAVDAGHHRELPVLERQPLARPVVDGSACEAPEAFLDRGDRVLRSEQLAHLGFGQEERHETQHAGRRRAKQKDSVLPHLQTGM